MQLQPVVPQLERLGQARVQLGEPIVIGPNLVAERRVIPIVGGRFNGELLHGEILPGGADWQTIAADGTVQLEARYTLRTDDGALVYIRNAGVRHAEPEVAEAIARGELVDPARYYFRTTPLFECGDPRYRWLNWLVAVCSGVRTRDAVLIDFYAVR